MPKSPLVRILIPVLAAAVAAPLLAEDAEPSERETMYERYLEFPAYLEGGEVTARWMADGGSFWYAEGGPAERVIYKVDAASNTVTELFDAPRLRQALTEVLHHEPPYQGVPFEDFTFQDEETKVRFTLEEKDFVLDLESYEIKKVSRPSPAEKRRTTPQKIRDGYTDGSGPVMELRSPDGRYLLTVDGHDLALRWSDDGRSEPLTDDGEPDYAWDVHRAAFSSDGSHLVAWKFDSRGVPKMPLIHWLKVTEEVEWTEPYPKAGGPIIRDEAYVIDVNSKRRVRIEGIEPEHRYWVPGWRSGGSEVLIFKMDRTFKRLDLLAADPESGKSRVVLTETQPTFIGGLHFLVNWREFHTPLEDPERFLWLSERDGWRHIYLYDYQGQLIRRLSEGEFPVLRVVSVDDENGWVYYLANGERERPYDTHLYRVGLDGKGTKKLTDTAGEHGVQLSPSKKYFVDVHSTAARPPVAELRSTEGDLVRVLSEADTSALREELRWQPPETFRVKADDGETDLYGVLYKPYDFDPSKSYPVLDYIYNGPFTTWAPQTFLRGVGLWGQALSQLGYIVMIVDGRGTIERGKAFQDVVYRNFGRHEIPDHVAALKQVAAERQYMDLERVGIFGGSWGGYMTIRAMVLAPEVYKVGIATNPVSDLEDHAAVSIEGYMDLPRTNREGYDYGSSLKMADKLEGKLFLVHGTSDVNAPFSATMRMVEALVRAGKPFDLLVLPDQSHWFTGQSGKYAQEATRRYLEEHLKP